MAEDLIGGGMLLDQEPMNVDITSRWIYLGDNRNVSIQLKTEGSVLSHAGTIYFRVTNVKAWDPEDLGTTYVVVAGATRTHIESIDRINERFLQLFFDRTAGDVTDLLSANVNVNCGS